MKNIQFQFRWPIKQVSEQAVTMDIPQGDVPLVNPDAIDSLGLSAREIEDAEGAVVRAIALIK